MHKPLHHSDSRLVIALALLVIGLVTFAAAYFSSLSERSTPVKNRACTEEAKLCPGGTTVSRTGPNCEFTACPSMTLPDYPGLAEEPIVVPGSGVKDEGKIEDGVMCTQEVKMCSDGSYVGRSGPNCAFAPCPKGTDTDVDL